MIKKTVLPIILSIGIYFGATAQINVFEAGSANIPAEAEGMFYSLPQTVIQVDIVVNKIRKVKGPYAEYADQMLGLTQVILVNSTEYELKDIRLTAFNEPDPAKHYFIQLPQKQKDRQAVELFLSDEGILTGVGELKAPTGVKRNQTNDLSTSFPDIPELASPNVFERMDTVIKRISLDTTIIEQKFFKKTSAAKTQEQKAREASEFVLKLDESMYNLITGYQEVSYEKGTMEFMYNQMNSMKQDYLELFKGVKSVSSETFSFFFVVDKSNPTETLCRFSISKGVLPKTSASGDAVQIQAESLKLTNQVENDVSKFESLVRSSHGFYYRIPEKADLSIKMGGKTLLVSKFLINQLGVTTFLPSSSFRNIGFDHNTGTVKHVVLQ